VRRGEAVHDCGRFPSISGVELAQDVRDVDARSADADNEFRGDLAVGEAAGDEGENLGFPRRQAEKLFQVLRSVGCPYVGRLEIEAGASCEQLELGGQRPRSDPYGCGVRLPQRLNHLGT
jgi:hypothetical protein